MPKNDSNHEENSERSFLIFGHTQGDTALVFMVHAFSYMTYAYVSAWI